MSVAAKMKAPVGLIFSTLEAQRQAGGRLVVALIWSIVPMLLIARLETKGAPIGLTAAAITLAVASTVVLLRAGDGSLSRMAIGVALMAQLSLLIPALAGHPWQAEMHVTYFAALGLLVIYCDWAVIAAAAAAILVSQLGLSVFASHTLFEGAAAWGRLIVQAVVVAKVGTELDLGASITASPWPSKPAPRPRRRWARPAPPRTPPWRLVAPRKIISSATPRLTSVPKPSATPPSPPWARRCPTWRAAT